MYFFKTIKEGFFLGIYFSLVISLIIGIYMLKLNFHFSFLFFCSFIILLMIYYGLIFMIIGIFLSIFFYFFIIITKIRLKQRKISIIFITILATFSILFRERYIFPSLPFDFLSFTGILVDLLIIATVFVVFYFLVTLLFHIIKKFKINMFFMENKLLILILFIFSFFFVYHIVVTLATPEYLYDPFREITLSETGEKVIFIGIDGVTRLNLEPLIQQGKMPNLQKLIETGCYANKFKTIMPPSSTTIWNVIFTGKKKSENGITDGRKTKLFYSNEMIKANMDGITLGFLFAKLEKFGLSHYYNFIAKDRITKPIWNILSEANKNVTIIGHYLTWPAEPVNGYLITDYSVLNRQKTEEGIKYLKENLTYPDSLLKELDSFNLISGEEEIGIDEVSGLINIEYVTENFSLNEFLRQSVVFGTTNKNIALYLLNKTQTDYFFVYLRGTDSIQHLFWKYKEPNHFYPKFFSLLFGSREFAKPEEDEIKVYNETLDNYYQYTDEMIGEIVEKVDENTTIIIASGHGQRYGHHMRYPFPGVFIINGKNIKQNISISDASIYDLTPTILYFLGLPVAEDMNGKVITEAINEDFLKKYPVRYIKTYEDKPISERM